MVVIGLGSNVGDKLNHLRQALLALKKLSDVVIQSVSPIYLSDALLPENAPPEWDMPHLNAAIACETTLAPLALLKCLKAIEARIGRKPLMRHWGPRIIDIDILVWDDQVLESDALTLPHKHLESRPFALWPLADVAPFWRQPLKNAEQGLTATEMCAKWGSRFNGNAPFRTKQINQRLEAPALVGILNVTPDSFSDGGRFMQTEAAILQTTQMIEDGAEIIDIGAESTAPNAKAITPTIEWQRLFPVLEAILATKNKFFIQPKISIDTFHPETAKKALALGVDWINDVTGLINPAMQAIVADSKADCVMMHHLSMPASRDHILPLHEDAIATLYAWAERHIQLLESKGIAREKIIFDPGIGFGKVAAQSLAILKNVQVFKALGVRLLIGHSRKSFLSLFTDKPFQDRDNLTNAISLYLSLAGVELLRVHDVARHAEALKVFQRLAAY